MTDEQKRKWLDALRRKKQQPQRGKPTRNTGGVWRPKQQPQPGRRKKRGV